MHYLYIDLETRSSVDLSTRGLDRYAAGKDTEILMMAWAFDESAPVMWFPPAPLPDHVELMLRRPEIKKVAWNVSFERTMLKQCAGINIPIKDWIDPSTMARYASLPGNLAGAGGALGLPEEKMKMSEGKKLMKLFSSPNKKGLFNQPADFPVEWEKYVEYCKQDVRSEREIMHRLRAFALPPMEVKAFRLDAKINEFGIPVDMDFVRGATKVVNEEREALSSELLELTGLANPNSVKQLLPWLQNEGYPFGSLAVKPVARVLSSWTINERCRRALELRVMLAKSSTAKLETLLDCTAEDGRLRRQFVYYGAARTGRWSGREVQLQNFPRGIKKNFDLIAEAVRSGNRDEVRKHGDPIATVSSVLRGAFRCQPDEEFVVSDLSAIESRVLAWLTDCNTILDVYNRTEQNDLYTDFGTRLFNRPYDELREDDAKRQVSKTCILSCGYGLGGGQEKEDQHGDIVKGGFWGYATSAGIDISQTEAHRAVQVFRETYPEIPRFWKALENAAIEAMRYGEMQTVGKIKVGAVSPNKLLYFILPSGRRLHYMRPKLTTETGWNGAERVQITYEDIIIGKTWGRQKVYGGKFCAAITQAIARDVLVLGLLNADEMGFPIVGHAHDEGITVVKKSVGLTVEKLNDCMTRGSDWTEGLPLKAEGFCANTYRKG